MQVFLLKKCWKLQTAHRKHKSLRKEYTVKHFSHQFDHRHFCTTTEYLLGYQRSQYSTEQLGKSRLTPISAVYTVS